MESTLPPNASSTSSNNTNNIINEATTKTIIVKKRTLPTVNMNMKMENPFTIKVFQIFTGFGVGCGLGIGVGTPLNFRAFPMLNQVMGAASGATNVFSGVGRTVNSTLRKMGAKNIKAGVGCGVGFGHGFGVGLALKPGVVNQIQLYIIEATSKLMMKYGGTQTLSIDKSVLPGSAEKGLNVIQGSSQDPLGSLAQLGLKIPNLTGQAPVGDGSTGSKTNNLVSEGAPLKSFGTRPEDLISSFLQKPVLGGADNNLSEKDGKFQSENRILRTVLKHQQVIEELMEENERLRQILVEDLKVPPSKLQTNFSGRSKSPCSECFECRRKERRR